MKKTMAMVMAVMMVVVLSVSAFAATGPLTVDQAKQVALRYAGVNATDAVFTKAYQTWDDGRQVYEIEFRAGNMEYDMDVDVEFGNVTDYNVEYFYGYNPQPNTSTPSGYYYDDSISTEPGTDKTEMDRDGL